MPRPLAALGRGLATVREALLALLFGPALEAQQAIAHDALEAQHRIAQAHVDALAELAREHLAALERAAHPPRAATQTVTLDGRQLARALADATADARARR